MVSVSWWAWTSRSPGSTPGSSATTAIPSRPAYTFTAGKPAAAGPPAGAKAPARRSISSWRRRSSRKGSPPKKPTGRMVATARSSPDRVEPRALARQAADQKPAAAVALDPAVVGRDPGAHLAADVPGGVVPNQEQGPHALGRELAGHPGEEGAGHGTHRSPGDEPQQ